MSLESEVVLEFIINKSLGGNTGYLGKACKKFTISLPRWAQCPGMRVALLSIGEWSDLPAKNVLKITVNPIKKAEALALIFGKIIKSAIDSNPKIKVRANLHFNLLLPDTCNRSSEIGTIYRHLGLYLWEGDKMKETLEERYDFCKSFFRDIENLEGA